MGAPVDNFYPRSPCGERLIQDYNVSIGARISIHALLAESDHGRQRKHGSHHYFYPRSPCGERHGRINDISRLMKISIHALLAESDVTRFCSIPVPPRFLSTLSLRRAT